MGRALAGREDMGTGKRGRKAVTALVQPKSSLKKERREIA